MTARGSEYGEKMRRPADLQDDVTVGRGVLPQHQPTTTAWLQRVNAACYNPATGTICRTGSDRFLTGRHPRLLSFIYYLLALVRSFTVVTAYRLPCGARTIQKSGAGFWFIPALACALPSPIALAAKRVRTRDMRRKPQTAIFIMVSGSLFPCRPAPRAGGLPGFRFEVHTPVRCVCSFVCSTTMFSAPRLFFEDGMETDGKHCRSTRARGGVAS